MTHDSMKTRMHGFTLLETLVALAIIGIAMAAAMRSTRFAIDTVSDLKARTAAGWVAQNLASELRATRVFPPMGASSGRAVQGRQEFLWRQEIGGTPNYSFRRVEIKVFLPERPEYAVARQIVYVARQQN
ncbi:MAG: type II secretion system minor pseudopilin GspI [Candidatus Accumulibacter sp.]|jgi:general secretion pathway protein I|nr:type II secretion system minor pseudopilin GspI [Accumulibacter sp.]